MEFKIDFTRSPEYVYIQTEGEASVLGFERLLRQLVGSPAWRTGAKQLVDHRSLSLDNLSAHDMLKITGIVKSCGETLGNGRCAFVINDALGFGLARMYELLGGEDIHKDVAVFYTIEEAVAWLKA